MSKGISVPFLELTSAKQLDKPTGNEVRFRLEDKREQQLEVTSLKIYELCGRDSEGERIRLSLSDVQPIQGLRLVNGKNEPAEKSRLKDLLQNAQTGHSWKRVATDYVICNRNHAPRPCVITKPIGRFSLFRGSDYFDVVGPGWSGPALRAVYKM